jgi:hypothetical protein
LRLVRAHVTFDIQIDNGETLSSLGTVIKDENGQPGVVSAIVEGAEWATYATTRFVTDLAQLEARVNELATATPSDA